MSNKNILIQAREVIVLHMKSEIKAVSDIPLKFKIFTISRSASLHGRERDNL